MPTRSLGGAEYYVTFIDDATRKVWAYAIARKSDVFQVFQKWLALVENQSSRTLKSLRTDNGGEYLSHDFQHFCDTRGIKRELTSPRTPKQNPFAKKMNRTIQERLQCMLSNASLFGGFWAEAMKIAVHVITWATNMRKSLPKQELQHDFMWIWTVIYILL